MTDINDIHSASLISHTTQTHLTPDINILEATNNILDNSSNQYDAENDSSLDLNILSTEQYLEQCDIDYHLYKNTGNWLYAKMIINHANADTQRTAFFYDYLAPLLIVNGDRFGNILYVYYKNEAEFDVMHKFEASVGKYLVDNLKINEYKQNGLLYTADNKWNFSIIVITTKNMYSANRYITDSLVGMY
jgi:hypothetical protein